MRSALLERQLLLLSSNIATAKRGEVPYPNRQAIPYQAVHAALHMEYERRVIEYQARTFLFALARSSPKIEDKRRTERTDLYFHIVHLCNDMTNLTIHRRDLLYSIFNNNNDYLASRSLPLTMTR